MLEILIGRELCRAESRNKFFLNYLSAIKLLYFSLLWEAHNVLRHGYLINLLVVPLQRQLQNHDLVLQDDQKDLLCRAQRHRLLVREAVE